jgi:CrcB protein
MVGVFFMNKWLSLVVGSVAGGFARYLFSGWIYSWSGTRFPYGTLLVNLSGCFLIGIFDSLAETRFLLDPNQRILLMVGFCGAYTTFSTLILETSKLISDGQMVYAGINFLGSGVLGLVLFRLGLLLGNAI